MYSTGLFLLSALPLLHSASARSNDDKILLSTVHSLTFHDKAMTSHRRVSAVPQLTCEGPACPYYTVSSLRCTNAGAGYDTEDIQWTCTASLPSAFKLGATDVQCEGYSSSRDKHVLRGSCGATYRLMFTEEGEREYAEELSRGSSWFSSSPKRQTDEGSLGGRLFLILFVAVAAWIVWNAYIRGPGRRRGGGGRVTGPRRPGGGGGGGGGGWGPGGGGGGGGFGGWNTGSDPSDEPPPPYTPNPGPRYTKSAPSSSSSASGGGWGSRGFWGGLVGGATAGYLAGSRRSGGRQQMEEPRRRGWGGGGDSGGWGTSTAGSSSGSRSSGSGRTYESTGFGGTSRR